MGSNILLALGSLVMFGTFLGSSNRLLIGNTQIASQNEYYIAALSYAQSVIEEAKTKKFDGNLKDPWFLNGGVVLTPAISLGAEGTTEKLTGVDAFGTAGFRSEALFDDIDDYHKYTRLVNSSRAEGYQVSVEVSYVDPTSTTVVSLLPTASKRMTVKVTSPYFPKLAKNGAEIQDTLSVSYIFSRY